MSRAPQAVISHSVAKRCSQNCIIHLMTEFLTCTQHGKRFWTNVNAEDTKYLGCQNQRQDLLKQQGWESGKVS